MNNLNKLYLFLVLALIFSSCSNSKEVNINQFSLELMNLTIQVIHQEINKELCLNLDPASSYQCKNAFIYKADSLIIIDSIYHIGAPEGLGDCRVLDLDTSIWSSINYYKKINYSRLHKINLLHNDFNTTYFLIHQPYLCQNIVYVHIAVHGSNKLYSAFLVSFAKDAYESFKLQDIELMGFY